MRQTKSFAIKSSIVLTVTVLEIIILLTVAKTRGQHSLRAADNVKEAKESVCRKADGFHKGIMRFKKIIVPVFAVTMAVSLCACGNSSEINKTGSDAKATATAAPTKAADKSEGEKPEKTPSPTPEQGLMPDAVDLGTVESIIPGKVSVSGTDFVVGDAPIYMNGVNTPWDKWNDFGGAFNEGFWSEHFALLHENGINATRIWICCNGDVGMLIDSEGMVSGATTKHWEDLDTLFTLAEENGIYIMATLMSFDNFKDSNKTYQSWRKMTQNEEAIDSYVENYVIPFCQRYDDFDSLWSIDLCNEPDWVHENAESGQLAWEDICNLFAKEAAAIHKNSDVLVTVGFGMIKYNSDSYEGNYGSDEYLKGRYNDQDAYLDFYSTHFYEWEAPWFGFPFDKSPADFKLDGTKPCVIGEFPATGMLGNVNGSQAVSGDECYINCYNNGWNGAFAWTSNGVDACGSLDDFKDGALEVAEKMKTE